MAITFQQVNNPNFADSNRLLEVALAQSAKAAEGLQGTLNTAVGNVENANLAKVQQLVNSQTREQLQDPIYQQQMQGQIAQLLEPTGGTIDPLKANNLVQDRITKLLETETSQSNLTGAGITQAANQQRLDQAKELQPFIVNASRRKDVTESEAQLATEIGGAMSHFDSSIGAIERAISETDDPVRKAQLQAQLQDTLIDRDTTLSGYGELKPHVLNLALEGLEAKDAAKRKLELENLNTQSIIKSRATTDVNNTAKTAAYVTKTDADILNDAAKTRIQAQKLNSSSGYTADVKEAKSVLETYKLSPTAVGKDGKLNYSSITNQTRNRANEAARVAVQGDAINFQDYVLSIKDNTLSENQMEDIMAVMESKDIPDYQRIAYMKELQMSPDRSNNLIGLSSKAAIEKGLTKFLETYTTSDAARKAGQAHAAVYQDTINALTDLNESPYDIVKHLGLTLDFEGVEFLPQEIKDELGFDLAKHRANQARKQASLNNEHSPQAKEDFAKHEREWKYREDKKKTPTQLLIQGLGEDAKPSPFDILYGDSMQNSANTIIRKLLGK